MEGRAVTIHDSVLELIGGTPLVRLRKLPKPGGASVVAKVESRRRELPTGVF